MISIVCGIVTPSSGSVTVDGFDIGRDYKETRRRIGLVPQELHHRRLRDGLGDGQFQPRAVRLSAGPERISRRCFATSRSGRSKDAKIMELSGGMKRRVMIAKALSHEPEILFLDEPTAGVDVELRRDMWELVRQLRENGVTIILTTHYIEEAEEMADRVGVIRQGELILVEEKKALMNKLGRKELTLNLSDVMETIPPELAEWKLVLQAEGHELLYTFDANAERTGVPSLLRRMSDLGIGFKDLQHQAELARGDFRQPRPPAARRE